MYISNAVASLVFSSLKNKQTKIFAQGFFFNLMGAFNSLVCNFSV